MDIDDLVLAVVDACGEKVKGRTHLQKLAYFVSEIMGFDAGYEPHYYGPYSETVAATVQGQVSRKLLDEQMKSFPGSFVGHDFPHKRYEYTITGRGRAALEWRREQQDAQADFDNAEALLKKLVENDPSYKVLSWAAKLYLILLQEVQEGGTTLSAARRLADKEYGWPMTHAEIQEGLNLLKNADLVKTEE